MGIDKKTEGSLLLNILNKSPLAVKVGEALVQCWDSLEEKDFKKIQEVIGAIQCQSAEKFSSDFDLQCSFDIFAAHEQAKREGLIVIFVNNAEDYAYTVGHICSCIPLERNQKLFMDRDGNTLKTRPHDRDVMPFEINFDAEEDAWYITIAAPYFSFRIYKNEKLHCCAIVFSLHDLREVIDD